MLSHAAWRKRFAGNAAILGQTVSLNGVPHVIVGVLPASFHFAAAGDPDFWEALHSNNNSCYQSRGCHSLHAVARLRDGVTIEAADANIRLIAGELQKQYTTNLGQGGAVISMVELEVGRVRPILIVLLSGAGLLLLIACVNVTSLVLVRAEGRKREMAVRSALGGSRARLVSQFVTEAVVLTATATALGLLAAHWTIGILISLIGGDQLPGMPFLYGLGLNWHSLTFAGVVALAAALLFSLAPASRSFSPDLREGLAEGSRGSAGLAWRRLGANLVVFELAIAVLLLAGAGLLGKSFYRLLHVDMGMQPEHLATLQVAEPRALHGNNGKVVSLAHEIATTASRLPGVASVAISTTLPVRGGNTMWIRVIGPRPFHGEHNEVGYREVSPGYFATLRAKLLRGRYFTEKARDDASKPPVVIVDRALALEILPRRGRGREADRHRDHSAKPMEIIGIVDDIKEGALDENTWPTLYVAFDQDPDITISHWPFARRRTSGRCCRRCPP